MLPLAARKIWKLNSNIKWRVIAADCVELHSDSYLKTVAPFASTNLRFLISQVAALLPPLDFTSR